MGKVDFFIVVNVKWISIVYLFNFGLLKFDFGLIIMMIFVMLIVMIELIGIFIGISNVCEKKFIEKDIVCGFRVEGIVIFLGGIFNFFLYIIFN